MPLYLDSSVIEASFSEPVAEALLAIKAAMDGKPATPSLAARLIKDHLLPLIALEHRDMFTPGKAPSWDDIAHAYPTLVFRSEGQKGILTEVASAINAIWTYTKSPPRDVVISDLIEVSHFFHLCDHLKIPVKHLRYQHGTSFDLFRFCKYCWRRPVPGRSICPVHTLGSNHVSGIGPHSETNHHSDLGFLEYKEGKRQRERFDAAVNDILTREVMEFHDSNFTAQILLPAAGIKDWLALRRPHLRAALALEWASATDETVIDILIKALHNPGRMAFSVQQAYDQANAMFSNNPILIWPMLLRAEAWLVARQERHDNWGGQRMKAGRKKTIPAIDVSNFCSYIKNSHILSWW